MFKLLKSIVIYSIYRYCFMIGMKGTSSMLKQFSEIIICMLQIDYKSEIISWPTEIDPENVISA